jgi:hypothetical protein
MVADRPLALIDTIARETGMIDQESGVLDPLVEGIRSIPFAGPVISGAGDVAEEAFDFTWNGVGALFQAPYVRLIEKYGGQPDSAPMDPIDLATLPGDIVQLLTAGTAIPGGRQLAAGPVTVGDFKEEMSRRGFEPQDFQDIQSGKKGWLDYGSKSVSSAEGDVNGIVDFATRGVLDPLNLVFAAGPISKAMKVPKVVRVARVAQIAKTRHPLITQAKAKSVAQAAVTMGEGSVVGVTQSGAAKYVLSKIMTPARLYRNAAYATTGVQVGINSVDMLVNGDAEPPDGFLGDVFEFARKWGDHKPLAKNDLFALYMIMKVPGRTILEKSTEERHR